MPFEVETQQRIHVIGFAHHPPIGSWNWHEGCRENLASIHSALLMLRENPDVKMAFGSAVLYLWVKRYDPKLFNKIKKMVKRGRWEIVGGWWTAPELSLISGESLIRQGFTANAFLNRILVLIVLSP
jgi:alpha-mannosidase